MCVKKNYLIAKQLVTVTELALTLLVMRDWLLKYASSLEENMCGLRESFTVIINSSLFRKKVQLLFELYSQRIVTKNSHMQMRLKLTNEVLIQLFLFIEGDCWGFFL